MWIGWCKREQSERMTHTKYAIRKSRGETNAPSKSMIQTHWIDSNDSGINVNLSLQTKILNYERFWWAVIRSWCCDVRARKKKKQRQRNSNSTVNCCEYWASQHFWRSKQEKKKKLKRTKKRANRQKKNVQCRKRRLASKNDNEKKTTKTEKHDELSVLQRYFSVWIIWFAFRFFPLAVEDCSIQANHTYTHIGIRLMPLFLWSLLCVCVYTYKITTLV